MSRAAAPIQENNIVSPTASNGAAVSAAVPQSPAFIHHHKGDYMFLGDSATVSLLQDLRMLVNGFVGDCDFSCDPIPGTVLGHPPDAPPLMQPLADAIPVIEKPSLEEVTYLTRKALWAAALLVDVFDKEELIEGLPQWLESSYDNCHPSNAVYHLMMALGLQATCPEKDALAHVHFRHGYNSVLRSTENPCITMVQCSVVIVWYLLSAARRNAAYMFLSLAIQAAHALGLHRQDVGVLFPPEQSQTREKLWRCIHILDGHMSATLGRPALTIQTRDNNTSERYSSHSGLAYIFTVNQVEIYEKRRVSVDVLERISQFHRDWTRCIDDGLATDQVSPKVELETPDGVEPSMALIHLKAAYYWSIILVTRHTLMEKAQQISRGSIDASTWLSNMPVLVDACVNSAIKTIDLFKIFLRCSEHPKKMPLVLALTVISSMVLGTAYFADLDGKFPVTVHLEEAYTLLDHLGQTDPLAATMAIIVSQLQAATRIHHESKAMKDRDSSLQKVSEMFGTFSGGEPMPDSPSTSSANIQRPAAARRIRTQPITPHLLPSYDPPRYSALLQTPDGAGNSDEDTIPQNLPCSISPPAGLDMAWLDSAQTYHFGSYDEVSAFFPIDQTYFDQSATG